MVVIKGHLERVSSVNWTETIRNYLFLTIGATIMIVNFNIFMAPANIAPGGMGGLTFILNHYTGIPRGTGMLLMSTPLIALGFWQLGRFRFLVRTLYVTIFYTLGVDLTARFFPPQGIVDDLLVYRYADHHMVVVNASNIAKDFDWMRSHAPASVQLVDRSDELALLAVQGPKAAELLSAHVAAEVLELGYYRFTTGTLFGAPVTLSRTGYTGEDGFEIYVAPEHAAAVWEGVTGAGKALGLDLIGLGARDTLRLEMGYMLYGNDITDTTTPLEAGLGWTVKLAKGEFLGRDPLVRQKAEGLTRRLVGFQLEGRRIPRHGMPILVEDRVVGEVTSGTFGPSLERPIGMGYVEKAHSGAGTLLDIQAAGSRLAARVTARPFYTRGSHRT